MTRIEFNLLLLADQITDIGKKLAFKHQDLEIFVLKLNKYD